MERPPRKLRRQHSKKIQKQLHRPNQKHLQSITITRNEKMLYLFLIKKLSVSSNKNRRILIVKRKDKIYCFLQLTEKVKSFGTVLLHRSTVCTDGYS
jgi:hypothetical protein